MVDACVFYSQKVLVIIQIAQYLQVAERDYVSGMREKTEKTQKFQWNNNIWIKKGAYMLHICI